MYFVGEVSTKANHLVKTTYEALVKSINILKNEANQHPHLEVIRSENFFSMTVGQAVVWASQDIDPKYQNPELTTSEPVSYTHLRAHET